MMKQTTTLSTLALVLAAGAFALVGGCSKSEQSASLEETQAEIASQVNDAATAVTEKTEEIAGQIQESGEQALEATEQAATDAAKTIAGETE